MCRERLRNLDGDRFMDRYDERAELAPRDIVSRAITAEMLARGDPHVLLDMRELGAERIETRFPGIATTCRSFGVDPATDPVPVRPSAHYFVGGIKVNQNGESTVRRLYGCGEVTASGVHGANRLGSNSLLEGLVYGARAGDHAGRMASGPRGDSVRSFRGKGPPPAHEHLDLLDMRNSLDSLVGRSAGILRDREPLQSARQTLDRWAQYALVRRFDAPAGWELQNMMTISRLLIEAAWLREESRGAHARRDYPECDDARWRGHVNLKLSGEPTYTPLGSTEELPIARNAENS